MYISLVYIRWAFRHLWPNTIHRNIMPNEWKCRHYIFWVNVIRSESQTNQQAGKTARRTNKWAKLPDEPTSGQNCQTNQQVDKTARQANKRTKLPDKQTSRRHVNWTVNKYKIYKYRIWVNVPLCLNHELKWIYEYLWSYGCDAIKMWKYTTWECW